MLFRRNCGGYPDPLSGRTAAGPLGVPLLITALTEEQCDEWIGEMHLVVEDVQAIFLPMRVSGLHGRAINRPAGHLRGETANSGGSATWPLPPGSRSHRKCYTLAPLGGADS